MTEAFGKRWGNYPSFTYLNLVGWIELDMQRLRLILIGLLHIHRKSFWNETSMHRTLWLSPPSPHLPLPLGLLRLGTGTDAIEGTGSINPFLLSGKAVATQAQPQSRAANPVRAPSTRCKGTVRWIVGRDATIAEEDRDDKDAMPVPVEQAPCVAGEFRAALDKLFDIYHLYKPQ